MSLFSLLTGDCSEELGNLHRDFLCTKREIDYSRVPEGDLRFNQVHIMIGGEEMRLHPFYPPEAIAMMIIDLMVRQGNAEGLEPLLPVVHIYLSPGKVFNGYDDDQYLSEEDQIVGIKARLLDAGISPEYVNRITFIASEKDVDAQDLIRAFQEQDSENELVQTLEGLYANDSDFRGLVDRTIPERANSNPDAYKYCLFELAVIIKNEVVIRAGDVREKLYDAILQRFGERIVPGERGKYYPIYWKRDNLLRRYKDLVDAREEILAKASSNQTQAIKYTVAGSVVSMLAALGLGFGFGRMMQKSDPYASQILEVAEKQMDQCLVFRRQLDTLSPMGYRGYSGHTIFCEQNKLLHEGRFKRRDGYGFDGPIDPEVYEMMEEKKNFYIVQLSNELIAEKNPNYQISHPQEWAIYCGMMRQLAARLLDNKVFEDYAMLVRVAKIVPAYETAEKFLELGRGSIVDPNLEDYEDSEFTRSLIRYYELEAEELLRDEKEGLRYIIVLDQFGFNGRSIFGPDAYILEARQNILALCESCFSAGRLGGRNYSSDVVSDVHSLYRDVCRLCEGIGWERFEYIQEAADVLSSHPEFHELLTFRGLDSSAVVDQFPDRLKRYLSMHGFIYKHNVEIPTIEERRKLRALASQKWEEGNYLGAMGGWGATPGQHAKSVYGLISQYRGR